MVLTTLVSTRTSTSVQPTAAAAAASPPRSHRSLLAVNAGASPAGVGPDLRTPEGRAAAAQQYREQQQHWQQQQQQGFEPFQTPIPPPQHTPHFSAPAPSAGYTYPAQQPGPGMGLHSTYYNNMQAHTIGAAGSGRRARGVASSIVRTPIRRKRAKVHRMEFHQGA